MTPFWPTWDIPLKCRTSNGKVLAGNAYWDSKTLFCQLVLPVKLYLSENIYLHILELSCAVHSAAISAKSLPSACISPEVLCPLTLTTANLVERELEPVNLKPKCDVIWFYHEPLSNHAVTKVYQVMFYQKHKGKRGNAACPLYSSVSGRWKVCLTDGGVEFADGARRWLADGSVAAWKVKIFSTSQRKRRSRPNGRSHNALRLCPIQSQWDALPDAYSGQAG